MKSNIEIYIPYHPTYARSILAEESHLHYVSSTLLINLQYNQKGTKISLKCDPMLFRKSNHNHAVNDTKKMSSVIKREMNYFVFCKSLWILWPNILVLWQINVRFNQRIWKKFKCTIWSWLGNFFHLFPTLVN